MVGVSSTNGHFLGLFTWCGDPRSIAEMEQQYYSYYFPLYLEQVGQTFNVQTLLRRSSKLFPAPTLLILGKFKIGLTISHQSEELALKFSRTHDKPVARLDSVKKQYLKKHFYQLQG